MFFFEFWVYGQPSSFAYLIPGFCDALPLYIFDNDYWPFFVLCAFFLLLFFEHAVIHQVHELDDLLIGINRVATHLLFPRALAFFSRIYPNPKQKVELKSSLEWVYTILLLGLKVVVAVESYHYPP
jgi:hypothetical protein